VEPELATGEVLFRLGVVILLVLANGFFVAAEFSLVGARRTHIEALARKGSRRAKLAHSAINKLDYYISGTQLGITLASLGLGWVGESTLAGLFEGWFTYLPASLEPFARHGVASALAFAMLTFLHIVIGELAPKSLALLFPEDTSMWTAGPLIAFSRVAAPFIYVLNGTANLMLKAVGLRPPTGHERVHRPEEIEILLRQTHEQGLMNEEPVEMIRGVFALSEITAAEVMTPRTEVVAVPHHATLAEIETVMLDAGHSRVPVYEDNIDQIIGVVLSRDLWRARRDGHTALEPLIRSVPFVPESKQIEDLLRELQEQRIHMAVVIDEFGGTAGVVTMEDLLEEIVGEIIDEHEPKPGPIIEEKPGEAMIEGTMPIWEANEAYGLALPEDDYTTVGGYVMGRLGRIAEAGDEVTFDTGTLRVISMDGRRIDKLHLTLKRRRTDPLEDALY
jgi:CBS domain containing-hemolysin-like protein